jgi:acyl-CoA thioester hydrolase
MDELIINPQPADSGAMGHISNVTLPVWFQEARKAMFERVAPDHDSPLLVVRYEVELLRQMFPGARVTIRSAVEKIGNSSIQVAQEAWQHDQLAATGLTTLVNFDELNQCSQPFTTEMRERLTPLLVNQDGDRD